MKAKMWTRLLRACALTLMLLAAAPLATAAGDSVLTIESPDGYTQETLPVIRGSDSEPGSPVRITLESGGNPVGEPFQAVEIEPEHWEAIPPAPLEPGQYQAIASLEDGASAITSFTVVAAPIVTIDSVASPSTDATPTLSGRAGADPWDSQVTVRIYDGSTPTGKLAQAPIQAAPNTDGMWSTGPVAKFAPGVYSATAEQGYHGEQPAVSESITFTVASAAPAPAPAAPPSQPLQASLSVSLVPPSASFTWLPANPLAGEPVSLVSTSLGGSSAIVSFAWDPAGSGPFITGGPIFTTTFASPGSHLVRLLVKDADGAAAVASATIHVGAARRRLMQPFPIVRIAGGVTSRGANLRLLAVQAPPGALVAVRCRGRHCAAKSQIRMARATATSSRTGMSLLTFAAFERVLPAGTVLQVVITRGTDIGKYTSFLIRRGHLPVRNDACVEPGNPRPIACPAT